ncbi:MAG: acyltransferase [Asticcacaulis sp.]|uniref:acyltransferase family protein n=1 Tax=Asticcacaulis sp. TaxID=1872648 RepID=UPI0039E63059
MSEKRAIGPDILRGLAILLVAATHMPGAMPSTFWTGWQQFGWLGVDIFFVLSGYLIGTELLKPVHRGEAPDLRIFYLKRAFRILPAFWFVLALYAFPIMREGPTVAPAWRFLTFTVNFGLDIRTARTFSHAWSLCVEEHFYLLLPLLILLFRRFNRSWLPFVFALTVIAGGMCLRHSLWLDWKMNSGTPADFLKHIYYPSYCRIDGLLMGVCLAAIRLYHGNLWRRYARPAILLPLAALCIGITGAMNIQDNQILSEMGSVIFYPLFSLGVALLLSTLLDVESHIRFMHWSGLGFIAAISYSFYLSQKIVYHIDKLVLPGEWTTGWAAVVVFYITAIAFAAAMHFAIEQPFMKLRNRVLAHMKKPSRLSETALNSIASE